MNHVHDTAGEPVRQEPSTGPAPQPATPHEPQQNWEPGAWSLLGGERAPEDRSLHDTVRRELDEEAGLDLDVLEPFAVETLEGDDGETVTVQVFAGRWNGDPSDLTLTEGVMLHWFAPQVVPRLRTTTSNLIERHARAHPAKRSPSGGNRETVVHVVGVHLYLENAKGEVLLGLRHPDSAYAGNMHHFLAGHCERESALRCLVREAQEEAGLLIDPADAQFVHAVHLVDSPGAQPRMQLVFRVRRWEGRPELREPDKCLSWGWWHPDRLPARVVPYTRAAIEGVSAGRPFPVKSTC